jgi:hypothetical protein
MQPPDRLDGRAMELSDVPQQFAAATTVIVRKSYADYPVGSWTAKLVVNGAVKKEFAATVDAGAFLFTLPASGASPHTGELTAGDYSWIIRVTATSGTPAQQFDVESGHVTVTPDLASATAAQVQPYQERVIALLKARIEDRLQLGADNESMQLLGQAVSKIPIEKCHQLIKVMEQELYQLRNPGVLGVPVDFAYGRPR